MSHRDQVAFMERRLELCSPLIREHTTVRKTSAEIVSEARQSLRVQSTRRPFTPRDGHRQLFGKDSIRADCENRPLSSFSLHAQNFDTPDSRPSSGTRFPPLDQKSVFPDLYPAVDPLKALPKPPIEPLEGRKAAGGARARLLRARSFPTLPPVVGCTDDKARSNLGPEQKQPATAGLICTDQVHRGRPYSGPCSGASVGKMQPRVDSAVRPMICRPGWRTELKNRESASSTEEDAESLVWKTIGPLLQKLEAVAAGSSEYSMEYLCDLCDGLHGTLAEADMLGRHCKKRPGILRAVFRLIDLNSAQLNLHIAKLCLALSVSGNNLLNICRLIFKISCSESNDVLFENNLIIDLLLRVLISEDVSVSGEALLYCVGTLKFLSGNTTILKLLLDKNFIAVAQKLLQKLCKVEESCFSVAGHILVQLTAALRNLADHPDSRPLFVSYSIMSKLCLVLLHHHEDEDICTNISRLYSKLSCYSECCLALAQTPSCYQLFLELLSKHHQKQDIVVRLLFTLGNLTAKDEDARQMLFQCEGCMETFLHLYNYYQQRDEAPHTLRAKEAPFAAPEVRMQEDVLVKLVRVLANMCIHPAIGPALASNRACLQLLIETMELRSVHESQELLINVAATINNLSFYKEESSVLRHSQLSLAKLMLKLLLSSKEEAMLEATRVFGNLSQSKEVRDFIIQNKVHRFVVMLLDSKSREMCFSACGVITNLALDPPNLASLSLEGAAAKLADCLKDFGAGDWKLAGQVCQALWNMSCSSEKLLDAQERESLLELLASFLDEDDTLKWTENVDVRDFHKATWEVEFVPVAQKLLRTL